MSAKPKIVIKDACIFFDLLDLDLMDVFYYLDWEVYTTSYVVREVANDTQIKAINKQIDQGKLKIDDTGTLNDILFLLSQNGGLSFADSSVLELALRNKCTLLSSDGILRKATEKKGLSVGGMLWVVEQLYNAKLITRKVALEKLQRYPQINKRAAPQSAIDDLINRIQQINN